MAEKTETGKYGIRQPTLKSGEKLRVCNWFNMEVDNEYCKDCFIKECKLKEVQ